MAIRRKKPPIEKTATHEMFDRELTEKQMARHLNGLRVVKSATQTDHMFHVAPNGPIEINDLRDYVILSKAEYRRIVQAIGEQEKGDVVDGGT